MIWLKQGFYNLVFNKLSLFSLLILCYFAYGQSQDSEFKSNNIVINSGAIEVEKKSNKIFTLVVMKKNKNVGVISMHDLIQARIL